MEAMSSSNSYPKKPGASKPKPAVAPKPVEAVVEVEPIAIYDAIVELPEPEVVVAADMEVSEKAKMSEHVIIFPENPTPLQPDESAAPTAPIISNAPEASYAVVSGSTTDAVHLSKIVFKNLYNKKSLSVHHLQRRLNEWGFNEAYLDKDGYFGDYTKSAVTGFQTKVGLPATGVVDGETLKAVFENDNNVSVILD